MECLLNCTKSSTRNLTRMKRSEKVSSQMYTNYPYQHICEKLAKLARDAVAAVAPPLHTHDGELCVAVRPEPNMLEKSPNCLPCISSQSLLILLTSCAYFSHLMLSSSTNKSYICIYV